MPLTLYVDGARWRQHLQQTVTTFPGLIPVIKGNGYGFGTGRLARRADWLGADMIAVGSYREVADVERRFGGDIVVLEPWRPFLQTSYGDRIIHTVGRADDLAALGARPDRPRVVLEALTSMRRHGFPAPDLVAIAAAARGVRVEAHAIHLPLRTGHLAEVESWLTAAPASTWLVSHLAADELTGLSSRHPEVTLRPRVGTGLWLADRQGLRPRATVLDAHDVHRGDRTGYRQRKALRDGCVLVVSGGTANGIGLEAPTSAVSARQRAVSLARGGLEAAGQSLSPFLVAGVRRWFVEPPHMQVSMVFLPSGVTRPQIGDELEVQVRYTTTWFDRVEVS